MRSCVGIFGLVCGLVVIGLVARYGYKTTEETTDAIIMAFMFGAISAGGLFGHVVAVRLWGASKTSAVLTGAVGMAALIISLTNSLGAIAGRADKSTGSIIENNGKVEAAEKELARLEMLRREMRSFDWTSAEAVDAARTALGNATVAKNAECGNGDPKQRGKHCKDKENAEAAASTALTVATNHRALTAQADNLEQGAKAEREKLAELGSKRETNVQGAALARLFRLPDSEAAFAAVAQQFGIAVVVELIIIMCLLAWEILRHEPNARMDIARREHIVETLPAVTDAAPLAQKLIAAPERPSQQVMRIMTDALTPAPGMSVALDSGYRRYAAICAAEGVEPVPPEAYLDAMVEFCRAVGLSTRSRKGRVHLVNVAFAGEQIA